MLVDNHYTVLSQEGTAENGKVYVRLCPECSVYEGHFPGEPISPGVCNIQMLLECASKLCGRQLRISYLQQCRMTRLITPDGSVLEVRVAIADGKLTGSIGMGEESYLTLKAEVEG